MILKARASLDDDRKPTYDAIHDETFARVVGRRTRPALGTPPDDRARASLSQVAKYLTRAPKGVFRYRTHEEANAAREQWTVELALSLIGTTATPSGAPRADD